MNPIIHPQVDLDVMPKAPLVVGCEDGDWDSDGSIVGARLGTGVGCKDGIWDGTGLGA